MTLRNSGADDIYANPKKKWQRKPSVQAKGVVKVVYARFVTTITGSRWQAKGECGHVFRVAGGTCHDKMDFRTCPKCKAGEAKVDEPFIEWTEGAWGERTLLVNGVARGLLRRHTGYGALLMFESVDHGTIMTGRRQLSSAMFFLEQLVREGKPV